MDSERDSRFFGVMTEPGSGLPHYLAEFHFIGLVTQLLPDSGRSASDKARYCRRQQRQFLQQAGAARDIALRAEYLALARRWDALARYHESKSEAPSAA